METHIILALIPTFLILILLFKDRRERRQNEARLIQDLQRLGKSVDARISALENSVREVPKDALEYIFQQKIDILANAAWQVDALELEILRLGGVRSALDDRIRIPFRNSPPDLPENNDYWCELSSWMREEKQWTCEMCGINLKERRYDLHVHHIFGKGFNSPQHLKVLCIACHAEEPGHEFMKARRKYKRFLRWKRSLL